MVSSTLNIVERMQIFIIKWVHVKSINVIIKQGTKVIHRVFHNSSFVITWAFVTIWVVTPKKCLPFYSLNLFSLQFLLSIKDVYLFKTVQSGSRSPVVGRSVGMSVGRHWWKMWSLVYQMVTKSYKPSYSCDSSDDSDNSDSSDSSDQKTIFTKTIILAEKNCKCLYYQKVFINFFFPQHLTFTQKIKK